MNTLASYNGRIGFEARFLWESGIMKRGTYDQNVARQRIEVLHRSAPGIPAVVAYDTLPLHLKSKVLFSPPYFLHAEFILSDNAGADTLFRLRFCVTWLNTVNFIYFS